MSNAAYILYLQSVMTDNVAKIQANGAVVAGLQQALDAMAQQSAATSDQMAQVQGATTQLEANNTLLASLIAQLSQPKKY